jgi:hypothetical protein
MMEEAFRGLLVTSSAVTVHAPASRINWGAHPQGDGAPCIVLTLVSDMSGYTLSGGDGLRQSRVQVDCYAATYGSAKLLSRAVLQVLGGHQDALFRGVFHEMARESREGGTNEAERLFRVSMDFMAYWRG